MKRREKKLSSPPKVRRHGKRWRTRAAKGAGPYYRPHAWKPLDYFTPPPPPRLLRYVAGTWNYHSIHTSPRPPSSRRTKILDRSLSVRPQPISDNASLKPPIEMSGSLSFPPPISPPPLLSPVATSL